MSEGTRDSFSESYRGELARRIRAEKDRATRRGILEKAKRTFDYGLAEGEKRAKGDLELPSRQVERQRYLHEEVRGGMEAHFASNEASLYKLFPLIREIDGAVIGVGSDQVLDIFANSKTSEAFVVDYTESVSLLTRTLLEVGIRHKRTFGCYPTPEEFVEYFEDENVRHIERFLSPSFTEDEVEKVMRLFAKGVEAYPERGKVAEVPYADYLRLRMSMRDDEGKVFSWFGTQEHLDKVLHACEEGKIFVLKGDVAGPKTMAEIVKLAKDHKVDINIWYWSNVEHYLSGHWDRCRRFWRNVDALPVDESKAVILRTSDAVVRSHPPKPQEVLENPVVGNVFSDWHYNAQTVVDWKTKVKRDEVYLHNGWAWEVKELEEKEMIPKTGLSTLGLKNQPPREIRNKRKSL